MRTASNVLGRESKGWECLKELRAIRAKYDYDTMGRAYAVMVSEERAPWVKKRRTTDGLKESDRSCFCQLTRPGCGQSCRRGVRPGWADHEEFWKSGRKLALAVGHPYQLSSDDICELAELVRQGCEVYVHAGTTYFPGWTVMVEVMSKDFTTTKHTQRLTTPNLSKTGPTFLPCEGTP